MKYTLSCKTESSISTTTSKPTSSSTFKLQHFHYNDLQAATNNFSHHKLLGKGSHGTVYKALLHNGRYVAVKKPSNNHPVNPSDNEIDILSTLRSPSLVNLLGFTTDREFMSNGTFYDALHLKGNRLLNWGRRIRLALQTAKAVNVLHSCNPPVIHRDNKSANVLFDRNFNARLGDFGLALRCCVDDFRLKSTPPAGTMGYLDPEYLTPDNLSTKSDVFSFGILLFEIISGRKAIDVEYSPPSIVEWAVPLVKKGKVLSVFDPRIPPLKDVVVRRQLALIATKCVRSCKERRPSMNEVVDWLTGLCKLVPLYSWNSFNNPCMMVEMVGQPVEVKSTTSNGCSGMDRNGEENGTIVGGNADRPVNAKSRRVYSDSSFKINLIELMAEGDDLEANSKSANWSSSFRFGSRR